MCKDTIYNCLVHISVICLVFLRLCGCARDLEVRDTHHGKVRGFITTPLPGERVENFLGIPYAKPPVGDLRFEPPKPPLPWSPDVLDATQLPPACLQIAQAMDYIQRHRPRFNATSENCLYVNIHVPIVKAGEQPLSVLVFIHGGSNMAGMGAFFDGDVLAAHGKLIVVTFNYRLAVLGFLGTGRSDFPGNYGLLDQVLLLNWLKENIRYFNGDPAKISLMGHSAGSFNVGLHILSPLAKDLFRSAICLSGSPLSSVAVRSSSDDALHRVRRIATIFDCNKDDLGQMKACLKQAPKYSLMADFPEIYVGGYHFPTIVDNIYIGGEPEHLFRTADLNVNLVVTGVTKDEGISFVWNEAQFEQLEATLRSFEISPKNKDLFEVIKHEYTHWEDRRNLTARTQLFGQAFGDAVFYAPAARMADILTRRNATVYIYKFEYRSTLDPRPTLMGVPHGADLFYLFGCPLAGHPIYSYTEQDKMMSRYYMNMISSIVKNGVATYPGNDSDPTAVHTAPEYNSSSPKYIRFYEDGGEARVELGTDFRSRKLYLWNKLIPFLDDKFSNISLEANSMDDDSKNVFIILFGIFLSTTIIQIVILAVCCLMIQRRR